MTGDSKRSLVIGVVAFLVGIILGVWPTLTYQRGKSDERVATAIAEQRERSAQAEEKLAFARLHLELGSVMLQAHRNNFGVAQRQGADLFQRLGELGRTAEDPHQAALARELAGRQGEILGDLAAMSPAAAEELGDVYLQWQQAQEGR